MPNKRTTRATRKLRTERDIELLEQSPYDELVTARSVYDVFRTTAELHGERPALTVLSSTDPDGVAATWSHAELFQEITRAANLLARLGVAARRPAAILSRTHASVPGLLWGAQTAGVASCINYLLSADVISALLKAENAGVLICPGPDVDAELWAKAQEVGRLSSFLESILVIGDVPAGIDRRFLSLEAEIDSHPGHRLVGINEPDRDDIAALFHTGGTTGVPKLVRQTHLNQIHAAWSLAQMFYLSETDVVLNGFPLFHVGGTSTVGLSILAAAGHVVMLTPAGFRNPRVVSDIWHLVERYRATVLGGVPTSIGAMADVPVDGRDLSSLRFVLTGGAPLPAAVAARFEQQVRVPLLEQYGMTESVAAIATTPLHGRHVRGSTGLRCPFSQIEIRKRAPSGEWQHCNPGETGEVTVRGFQIVGGYLDSRHNDEAFTPDGALVTGDLGHLDEHGYLYLSGREKDLIIRSGHNIDPSSIEEVANAHPSVGLSAAVGMPDEYAGEVPVVFVSPAAGGRVDVTELQAFIHERIHEPPARPRHVFPLEEIPVTGVGKIFKPALRTQATKHKLQMLIDALDGETNIAGLESAGKGDKAFRARLVTPARGSDLEQLKTSLSKALAELPVELVVEWSQ
ncbi:MAG: AMP-binding protein [Ectothiorhodospiraceae bacterium]|nr:AMP-binding protein [Ectothiorhodospiraceae bacterium]